MKELPGEKGFYLFLILLVIAGYAGGYLYCLYLIEAYFIYMIIEALITGRVAFLSRIPGSGVSYADKSGRVDKITSLGWTSGQTKRPVAYWFALSVLILATVAIGFFLIVEGDLPIR